MNIKRIAAILSEELYITKRSMEVIVDVFYFSITDVLIFGFISVYLAGQANKEAAAYIIMGIILWEIIRVTQYTLTVGSLWEVWSKNLSNLFVTPLTLKEYLAAGMLSGAIKSIICFIIVSLIANAVFNFNIFQISPVNLAIFIGNLIFFSWSLGIFILALIFRFGTRIQAFAWSLVFLVPPLTANYFPLEILPKFMQTIGYALPPTYVFEAARQALHSDAINWQYAAATFFLNIVYFLLALLFFNYMFTKSRETGQFARMET